MRTQRTRTSQKNSYPFFISQATASALMELRSSRKYWRKTLCSKPLTSDLPILPQTQSTSPLPLFPISCSCPLAPLREQHWSWRRQSPRRGTEDKHFTHKAWPREWFSSWEKKKTHERIQLFPLSSFTGNAIEADGIRAIAESLKANTSLTELSLTITLR